MDLSGKVLYECTVIESALLSSPTNRQSLWSNLVLYALVNGTLMKGDISTSPFNLFQVINLRPLSFHPRSQ